jgi:hypothetical protein
MLAAMPILASIASWKKNNQAPIERGFFRTLSLRSLAGVHQEQPECLSVPQRKYAVAARRSKKVFRKLAEKGTIMQYQKPQLYLVGDASKLIQTKGHDVIDVDIPGHAKFGLHSKLEEE